MRTYAYGYSGGRKSRAEIEGMWMFRNMADDYMDRAFWLADQAQMAGTDVGFGGGARSRAQQLALFLDRHYVCGSGISYNGKQYCLKSGMAPAAPPDRSFHQEDALKTPTGAILGGGAIDWIGDLGWLHRNQGRVGMKDFEAVNREGWHLQVTENGMPNSYRSYDPKVHILKSLSSFTGSTPAPAPTPPSSTYDVGIPIPWLRQGSTGIQVGLLQSVMKHWGWVTFTPNSQFGPLTLAGVKKMQVALKVGADGVYGSQSANALQGFTRYMTSLANANKPAPLVSCEWPETDADGWRAADRDNSVGVAALQQRLNHWGNMGLWGGTRLPDDGWYGVQTAGEVIKAQRYLASVNRLNPDAVDGVYGPVTRLCLCALVADIGRL